MTLCFLCQSLLLKKDSLLADFVAALWSSRLQPLSCKWSPNVIFQRRHFKANFSFLPLRLVTNPFPFTAFCPHRNPSNPPACRRRCRLHNWCKYCHTCQEVEAPLAHLCATLYGRTLSGESSLTPEVENQLVTGLIQQLVAARLFHRGDREHIHTHIKRMEFRSPFATYII